MKFALMTICILFIIFILLYIDFYFGRKKHLKHLNQDESPLFYGKLDIFPHGKELMADYFNELKQAKAHIHVLFYIVQNDQISMDFFDILKNKAQEGVEVRLLLDRLGSHKVSNKIITALEDAGVEFAFSNPVKFPFLFYRALVRNHRKITIIDGTIGYMGGFNIGKEYIDKDPKLSPWRDYHLKITGESVSYLQRAFLLDWKENDGADLLKVARYFRENTKGPVEHRLLPTEGYLLENSYLKLIKDAQKSITIGTPYFIPSEKIFAELLKAVKRGIRLTIIVPSISDHVLVKEASYRYFRPLLKEGAKVFQFKNGFYHAKTAIIDDKICDIGTANFDNRSLFLNKEINCYIYDSSFIERLGDVIKKDLLDSRPLLLSDLNQPNIFRSFKETIAGVISYFL